MVKRRRPRDMRMMARMRKHKPMGEMLAMLREKMRVRARARLMNPRDEMVRGREKVRLRRVKSLRTEALLLADRL
jgi:hypothetical protein